jgi:hypothetical protein
MQEVIKLTLCALLGLSYALALVYSVRLQIKHFGLNRFLEMSYYLVSFYFLSKVSSAKLIYCVVFSLDVSTSAVVIAQLLPSVFLFGVCSTVTYLW